MADTGHVKHNPTTNEVAIRTIFPEDSGAQLANMAWLIASTNVGARHANSSFIEGEDWIDLYVPVVEESPELPGS
jgi:hypothetical protein